MARQVVSYDDLDPPQSMSVQTTTTDFTASMTFGATGQLTAEDSATTTAPPTKKQRRDEATNEGGQSRDLGSSLDTVHENGQINSGNTVNLPSVQSLPPKPQVKKRGRVKRRSGTGSGGTTMSNNPSGKNASFSAQHWDEPGVQADEISYDEDTRGEAFGAEDKRNECVGKDAYGVEDALDANEVQSIDEDDDEESRELTHEEIWDDSALIAAWDAATEEYEAMHGKSKRWKKERAHKSPLWYNVPVEKPPVSSDKRKSKAKWGTVHPHEASDAKDAEADSSVPLNFETFVPGHDASLAFPGPPGPPTVPESTQTQLRDITAHYSSALPASPFPTACRSGDASTSANLLSQSITLSADEAFSRALGAMYWCGYWTAVYHVQRAHEQGTTLTVDDVDTEDAGEVQQEEEAEMLVSTQR